MDMKLRLTPTGEQAAKIPIAGEYYATRGGDIWSAFADRWLKIKPQRNPKGYHHFGHSSGGRRKTIYFHRAVLEAFVGPCPPGMQACHNNGNCGDNRLENLRWDTHASNVFDRFIHGTVLVGEEVGNSKLTREIVQEIRKLALRKDLTNEEIALKFGISKGTVINICKRVSWGWLAPPEGITWEDIQAARTQPRYGNRFTVGKR